MITCVILTSKLIHFSFVLVSRKAKEGNLLDQQVTAAGNMLCVLERTKDSGEVK